MTSTLVAAAAAERLCIGGFVPFTTTDFPGRIAAVIFCQGCPWHCGYCHNVHLQPSRAAVDAPEWSWPAVRARLSERRGWLDAVVFSGGEPTAQPALEAAIDATRAFGFDIGLHTAGIYPRRLARVLGRVDWVGLDIKAPVTGYGIVTGIAGSGSVAFETLDLLLSSEVAFEVRTTVHSGLTPPRVLLALARALADRGVRRWVLQPFRAQGCTDAAIIAAHEAHALSAELVAELAQHVPEITQRR
ncbi:MAG TPA: anaerobic ribonucleoside-triphosphate reductase activating protein [Casimicrobiaceae bacterium]|nr:anaerobic ribonucleoside-triphosphate reductase activating protein [Casimicrobiaceae bacterium]